MLILVFLFIFTILAKASQPIPASWTISGLTSNTPRLVDSNKNVNFKLESNDQYSLAPWSPYGLSQPDINCTAASSGTDPRVSLITWQNCSNSNAKWRYTTSSLNILEIANAIITDFGFSNDPQFNLNIYTGVFWIPENTTENDSITTKTKYAWTRLKPFQISSYAVSSYAGNPMASGTNYCASYLKFNISDPNTSSGNFSCAESWSGTCDYHYIGTEKGKTCGDSFALDRPNPRPNLQYDIVPASGPEQVGLGDWNITVKHKIPVIIDQSLKYDVKGMGLIGPSFFGDPFARVQNPGWQLELTASRRMYGGVLDYQPGFFCNKGRFPCGWDSGSRVLDVPLVDVAFVR